MVRQRRSLPADRGLLTLALLALLVQAIIGPHISSGGSAGEAELTGQGNTVRQIGYVATFGLILWAARAFQHPERVMVIPAGLCIALVWCWASVFWAIAPGVSARRIALTTLIVWAVLVAVRQLGFRAVVLLLQQLTLVVLVVSYVAVVIVPSAAIHQYAEVDDLSIAGAWTGILAHKNVAGPFFALMILLYLFNSGGTRKTWHWLAIAGAAFFLYKTSSKTSMGILAMAASAGWAFTFYDRRHRAPLIAVLALSLSMAGFLMADNWRELTAPLDNDEALTGRTQIWPVLFGYIHDHWLLGAGYGSFWNIGAASPIYQYIDPGGWLDLLSSGHNGYIDLAAQIGIPGLVIVVVAMIILPFGKVLKTPVADPRQRALLISFIVFCAGQNLTETTLFERDFVVQIFLTLTLGLAYLSPTRAALERERPQQTQSFSARSASSVSRGGRRLRR